MCTIGSVHYNVGDKKTTSYFKQCDLVSPTVFIEPQVKTSGSGIRYLAMTRQRSGQTPAWSGVNEYGVSFVAADSYITSQGEQKEVQGDVFAMYLQLITDCKTAEDALKIAKNFYAGFHEPDILMVGDCASAYFIEAHQGRVAVNKRTDGYFASTNHSRMMKNAVPYEKNHSTYLRLQRAEQILQKKPNLDGIKETLSDTYFGESVWSICRYADNQGIAEEELYYTQASVIFTATPKNGNKPNVTCEYVLNGNPTRGWKKIQPF